jgi:predicted transcriptional regulator of viral defense system
MRLKTVQNTIRIFSQNQGTLSSAQAVREGIQPRTLYQMRDTGLLVRECRGLYRLVDSLPWSDPDLMLVARRIPKGVICLISALHFHDLTTQIPHQIDVALPQSSEKPRLAYPPTRFVWMGPKSFCAGVELHEIDGVYLRVFGVAKTITDCFKFRNKIGLDVALEALREALRQKRCSIDEILGFARINRVERVIRPYLEALA